MLIKKYFKFHSTLDYESNEYRNCFVKFLYNVFYYLQNYTTLTGFIR